MSKLSAKLKSQLVKIQSGILKLRSDNNILITDREYKELLCETFNIPYEENISMELINVKDIGMALKELVLKFCRNRSCLTS